LKLSSGESATIKWVTVGGRTSAYVPVLQQLPVSSANSRARHDNEQSQPNGDESDSNLTGLTASDTGNFAKRKRKRSDSASATRRKTAPRVSSRIARR